MAEQLAAKLNTRLNYAPVESEEPIEGSAEDSGENAATASDVIQKFEEELEINDFPQPVRWKITSRVSSKTHKTRYLSLRKIVNDFTFSRRLWLRLANFLKQVFLFEEHIVLLAKKWARTKGNCI